MKKVLSIVLSVVLTMALIAGCSSPKSAPIDSDAGKADVSTGKASSKDTLIIGHSDDCGDMNPHGITSNSYVKIKIQSYETLMYKTFDGETVPQLATEWEWLDDCTLQIKLREGVKFHCGGEMTAEDVMFSLKTIRQSSQGHNIESINFDKSYIKDDYTVILVLDEPYTPLLSNLTFFPTAIFSKAGYEANGGDFNKGDIGTGPYVFEEWVESDHVIQKAFADYWGGETSIKKLHWKVIQDATNRAIELETGGCDLITDVAQIDVDTIKAVDGLATDKYITNDFNTIDFNCELEMFQNEDLRKAFAYSFDRNKATQTGWNGANEPMPLVLDPNHPMAFKSVEEIEAAGGTVIQFDLEKAKELFEKSGYADRVFKISTGPYNTYIGCAEAWAADLERIGIKTEIVSFDGATYVNDLKVSRNFEIGLWGTAPLTGDFDFFARHYYGDSAPSLNIMQCKDAEFDALVDAYCKETNVEKATELAKKAQLVLYKNYYAIPINATTDIFAYKASLKGFTDGSYQSPLLKYCYFE